MNTKSEEAIALESGKSALLLNQHSFLIALVALALPPSNGSIIA